MRLAPLWASLASFSSSRVDAVSNCFCGSLFILMKENSTFRRGSSDNRNSRDLLDVQDTTQLGYFSHVTYSRSLVQNSLVRFSEKIVVCVKNKFSFVTYV